MRRSLLPCGLLCVDEKTGMQALERRYADIPMVPGQPIRRELRRGKPFGFPSSGHDSDTFIELLDVIDTVYPSGRGHIIMDNLSGHDTPDVNEWFDEHPRWTRHFTPKHASWLNQLECWFSILSRQSEVPRDIRVEPEVVGRSERRETLRRRSRR